MSEKQSGNQVADPVNGFRNVLLCFRAAENCCYTEMSLRWFPTGRSSSSTVLEGQSVVQDSMYVQHLA